MPTEPQDRNAEAPDLLLPCPFCGSGDIVRTSFDGGNFQCSCGKCNIEIEPQATSVLADAAWNRRHSQPPQFAQPREQFGGEESWPPVKISQPPQNVEAGDASGDAAKGVVEEIAALVSRYRRTLEKSIDQFRNSVDARETVLELERISELGRCLLFSDRLRLALSATSSHGEKGMGDDAHERLRKAEGLLKWIHENMDDGSGIDSSIRAFLSTAPAQTPAPRDESSGTEGEEINILDIGRRDADDDGDNRNRGNEVEGD